MYIIHTHTHSCYYNVKVRSVSIFYTHASPCPTTTPAVHRSPATRCVNMIIIANRWFTAAGAGGGRASINQSVVPGARRIGGHPSAVVTDALQLFTYFFSPIIHAIIIIVVQSQSLLRASYIYTYIVII